MRRIRVVLSLLALILTAPGVLAQGSGSLTVRVVDGQGEPLPGAQVILSHETGNIKAHG